MTAWEYGTSRRRKLFDTQLVEHLGTFLGAAVLRIKKEPHHATRLSCCHSSRFFMVSGDAP